MAEHLEATSGYQRERYELRMMVREPRADAIGMRSRRLWKAGIDCGGRVRAAAGRRFIGRAATTKNVRWLRSLPIKAPFPIDELIVPVYGQ